MSRSAVDWWDGLEVHDNLVRAWRFLLYGLVALDAFWNLPKAPTYGVGGFNVSHLPALDTFLPTPTPGLMVLLWCTVAVLAGRLAIGAGGQASAVLVAAIHGLAIFVSQLDRYQHHYLAFVVLVVLAAVRWQDKRQERWPFRLLVVVVGVVYVWTAIAKLDPYWLDGTLPARFIGGVAPAVVEALAMLPWLTVASLWSAIGVATVVLELALAVAVVRGRPAPLLWVVGCGFHLAFLVTGFEIGRFPFYMLAFLLVIAPVPWERLDEWRPRRFEDPVATGLVVVGFLLLAWLGSNPRDYLATKGKEAWRANDPEAAEQTFKRMLELRPGFVSGWVALADLYVEWGRFGDALEAIEHARELDFSGPMEARVAWIRAANEFPPAFHASQYYAVVCDAGDVGVCSGWVRLWQVPSHVGADDVEEQWEIACARRDPSACGRLFVLAGDYLAGPASGRDPVRAGALYALACEGGTGAACGNGAAMFAAGTGVAREPERSRRLAAIGCRLGHQPACRLRGSTSSP